MHTVNVVLPTVYYVRNQLKMKKLKGDQFSRFTYLSHHAIDMTPNMCSKLQSSRLILLKYEK